MGCRVCYYMYHVSWCKLYITRQNMAPSTRCYPMDFVPGTTVLRLPRKYINISLILRPGVIQSYASKSKCMQIYYIHWVYLVFQPSGSYLSYKREIRIDKPYRDGSGQSILVSPDKSMLTIKFTLKKEIEISICKHQVHTSVHLCVNIVNVHS